MSNILKTGMVGAFTAAVSFGCGGSGSQPAEAPEPENQVETGYSTQPREEATGSVTTFVPTEQQKRVARVGDMLFGRVPGLEVRRLPNGDYTLRVRGPGTLIGSGVDEEPLLVVDGTPVPKGSMSSMLSALQPRDVERIDVLKDASSTAVYGVRGANGVIVITTRRPR